MIRSPKINKHDPSVWKISPLKEKRERTVNISTKEKCHHRLGSKHSMSIKEKWFKERSAVPSDNDEE